QQKADKQIFLSWAHHFPVIHDLAVALNLDLPAAVQAGGEADLALEAFDFQQAFDGEGEAKQVVVTGQGNYPDLAQARFVGFDEAFYGDTRLLQRVVQRQAHVVQIGDPVVGQRLHAARPGAEHLGQMGGHRVHRRYLVAPAGTQAGIAGEAFEKAAVSVQGSAPVHSLSSLPTSDRVKSAPMYLKCGRTLRLTRYQPGSPSTSLTLTWAARSGRRLRTSALGFSWSATNWRIHLFSSS